MVVLNPFVELIATLFQLYIFVLIAWMVLSWLISFNVVNRYQPAVQKINFALFRLTEPLLKPLRKYMPDLGSIDITPLVAIILLHFVEQLILYYAVKWS